ncbi:hypothetical protein DF022_16830 [Burkholderia cepacia]|nr:hypothetical protein DF023_15435 [Burkholderia cepacia]RQU03391.1 hypothetical protein DF022_16830 [Burkholderia cepacia]RQZ79902.1 hypothetical protein DF056_15950 [Burkholderia cepacia]
MNFNLLKNERNQDNFVFRLQLEDPANFLGNCIALFFRDVRHGLAADCSTDDALVFPFTDIDVIGLRINSPVFDTEVKQRFIGDGIDTGGKVMKHIAFVRVLISYHAVCCAGFVQTSRHVNLAMWKTVYERHAFVM